MRASGSIGVLCIGLAHRWEPERLFMIYAAYFDEAHNRGTKPDLIVACFLATARQWELFERQLKRLQAKYGFRVFHATDFRARQGEFKGWSDARAEGLITELAALVHTGLSEGLVAKLPHSLFKAEYLDPPFPKGMRKDSAHGFAFRFCLHQLLRLISVDRKRHKLNVVIEEGAPGDVVSIFLELKKEYAAIGYDVLHMISIGTKLGAPPLMVADFQAHLGLLHDRYVRSSGAPSLSLESPDPQKGRAAVTYLEFTAETVRGAKEMWQREKEERAALWRDARAARGAYVASKEPSSDESQP